MADEKVTLQLDLDDAEFVKKALSAKKNIQGLGDKDNLKGLLEGLGDGTKTLGELGEAAESSLGGLIKLVGQAGPIVAALAVAAYSLKAAFDLTVEAENIKAINAQFQILTNQVGIASEALEEGLKKAGKGLIDDTDLLKLANKAIVQMGASAERLPELLELSRKAAVVMGTDTKETFEALADSIARGNQRALKNAGIILDLNKVYRDYADSIGTTAGALSEAGKQQALLNAVLEKGQKDLAGINPDIKETQNSWTKFKTSLKEFGESFTLVFAQVVKPYVDSILWAMNGVADAAKNAMGWIAKITGAASKAGEATHAIGGAGAEGGAAKAPQIDRTAQLQQEVKFHQEMRKLEKESFDLKVNLVNSVTQIDALQKQTLLNEETRYQQAIQAINANTDITRQQRNLLIEQEHQNHTDRMLQIDKNSESQRIAMLDNLQKNSKTTFDGVANAAKASAAKETQFLTNAGMQGKFIFDKLSNAGVNAFDALGRGAATGADQLSSAILGSLADIASSYGKAMMLASLWPFNPAVFAAGAALVALGGFVSAKAGASGGGGGDIGAGGGGASSGAASTTGSETLSTSVPLSAEAQNKKTVSINIQGNYFDTDQTRMKLIDLIRESSDATDYQFRKIGQ